MSKEEPPMTENTESKVRHIKHQRDLLLSLQTEQGVVAAKEK